LIGFASKRVQRAPDRLAAEQPAGIKGRLPERAFAVVFVYGISTTREEFNGKPGGKQFGDG